MLKHGAALNLQPGHSKDVERSSVQTTNCVVMVPPKEFGFNPETAQDNEFQNPTGLSKEDILLRVMNEFAIMVEELRSAGVEVIEFDYPLSTLPTPDAVFPNNWFSTTPEGVLFTFPMACENRRNEVRPEALITAFGNAGYAVTQQDSLLSYLSDDAYLESTGAMVCDHINKTIYAALSQRCDRRVLEDFARRINYESVLSFQTCLPSGSPVYHTNVMMALGERFCVICDQVIPEYERGYIIDSIKKDRDIISISIEQMNQFCGNVLQLTTNTDDKVIAMSQSAYRAFTPAQREQLSQYGKLLPFDVSTIESIGGGSVRCMLAEVFLPRMTFK